MSRRPVRNFNLNVIVLNKTTIFEYYLFRPYTNKFHRRFKLLTSVKVPDNKMFGVFGRM